VQAPESRVTLARIVRARGRIGEVAAEVLTDFPERLTRLREVYLVKENESLGRPAHVRRCWLHGRQAVFHFEGVDSISAAQELAGCEVQVPLSERVELPAGKYFTSDLEDCEVWNAAEGEGGGAACCLGRVRGVDFSAGTPLLVVDTARGELLIPFAEQICTRIDTAARRIEVRLPEGLLELNQ
jgi:16S rRNA processing protein RimM